MFGGIVQGPGNVLHSLMFYQETTHSLTHETRSQYEDHNSFPVLYLDSDSAKRKKTLANPCLFTTKVLPGPHCNTTHTHMQLVHHIVFLELTAGITIDQAMVSVQISIV